MAAYHVPAHRNRRERWQLRVAATFLSAMLAVCGFFPGGRIFCEAKENDAEQEVTDFIMSYYQAHTPERVETLPDYVDDPESQEFQTDLLRQRVTLKECGVKGWENIRVLVLPMSDGQHWLAAVSCEMIVKGIDVGIPGLKAELVSRNENGELKIASYDEAEYSDAFIQEVRELSLSDEIVERNNEIAMLYNDLIAERPDIMEWVLEASQTIDREVGEALAEEEVFSVKADSAAEKSAAKKGSYTVKKGDCLWDIAEEQLGDGMLWSGLYQQNKDVVGDDPDLLYVGITLQLN